MSHSTDRFDEHEINKHIIKQARCPMSERTNVQYTAQNSGAVKSVTKASQWLKIEVLGRRRRSRGVLKLRIESFAGHSER
ncbi:hypothetical protein EVAR_56197_1 [Eumeta japonica]|uniref:Uncharacterized protein n=1 Tax=Eumeta variegata TaxID=151549 RepID=A0A4C1Y8G4_EUMVA|nr:hypothetical protein EVAR_56197_1 [Eumeta japonica]